MERCWKLERRVRAVAARSGWQRGAFAGPAALELRKLRRCGRQAGGAARRKRPGRGGYAASAADCGSQARAGSRRSGEAARKTEEGRSVVSGSAEETAEAASHSEFIARRRVNFGKE